MKRSYGLLVAALFPLALASFAGVVLAALGPQFETRDFQGLIAFVSIAMLADMLAIDYRLGKGHNAQSSLAFLPFLGIIVLFSPPIAALSIAFVVAVSQTLLRRNSLARSAVNISNAILTASAASTTYHLIHPVGNESQTLFVVGYMLAALIFIATNVLLAAIGLAYLKSERFADMIVTISGANGSNFAFDLLAVPIAAVPVLLYSTSPVLGVLVIVLPLLLINYSYASKKQVMDANKDLLRALVTAIETRDPYTSGHSERVASLSRSIALAMGLPIRQVDQIETAALLHDIGKIDADLADILRKPHELTFEERALMQTHPARGAAVLENLSSVRQEIIQAVLHHHERYDGKGYPDGLAGEDIPLAARIIMLCDSVDAMLSDRPYRKALTPSTAYDEVRRCAGTQFDPRVVDIVLRHSLIEGMRKSTAASAESGEPKKDNSYGVSAPLMTSARSQQGKQQRVPVYATQHVEDSHDTSH